MEMEKARDDHRAGLRADSLRGLLSADERYAGAQKLRKLPQMVQLV